MPIPVRLYLILMFTIPLTPKIGLNDSIALFPFEILTPFLLLTFRPRIFYQYQLQRILLVYFSLILATTVGSQIFEFSALGLLRCIKWFLYIPIFFFAAEWCPPIKSLVWFTRVATVTMLANLAVMVMVFIQDGFNIWGIISSGFSNRIISLQDGAILTGGGAHGIFGSYCVVAMCVALYLFHQRIGSRFLSLACAILAVASILISVSREATIVLFALLAGYLLLYVRVRYILVLLLLVAGLAFVFQDQLVMLPMIQKIAYSQESISSTGQEINMTMRMNTWSLIAEMARQDPWLALTGIGYNLNLFETLITGVAASAHITQYVVLPESLFMMSILYGGLGTFFFLLYYFFFVIRMCIQSRQKFFLMFLAMFAGLIVTNMVSGASLTSDLLYSQMLLILGLLWRMSHPWEGIAAPPQPSPQGLP